MNLSQITIKEARQNLADKKFSCVELVATALREIKNRDKEINSFISLNEGAIKEAKEIDDKIKAGEKLGELSGIPLAIKDNILVDGLRATAGSKMLRDYVAPFHATVIDKLKKEGAIIIGKANMDEFAMGSSGEYSAFGPTKNPHDLSRVTGGSSSGSAASVAAGFALGALGSDTGSSIRQPAAFCGLVGLKPTYGRVSRYGLMAMASSLDQIGPLAKNVEDAELIFNIIKGKDERDSTTTELGIRNYELGIKNLRIGLPNEYFTNALNPDIKEKIERVISNLEKSGVKIEKISLPHAQYVLPCYHIIMDAEASSNLARFDGVRFSKMEKSSAENIFDFYAEIRDKKFGPEVKRRIMLGTFVLSTGYIDAYYLKAQRVRQLIKKDFEEAFKKVDLIITPTTPTPAFKIGEKQNPLDIYLCDIFLAAVNLAGLPAASIPIGKINQPPLPTGLQIIAPWLKEDSIFSLGKKIENLIE